MSAHENSIDSYHEIRAEGKLSKRQALILEWLSTRGEPLTDREVAAGMQFPDMNCVRPRITELIQLGLLHEHSSVICPITNKRVRKVAPFDNQMELPL